MKQMVDRRTVLTLALAAGLGSHRVAFGADDYPTKPITWIVAYPAGGGSDFLARVVAVQLGKRLGQPVLIDNRPGAATIVGAQAAARAAADGYTVFSADNGSLVFNPALYSKLQYKVSDFSPVGLMARFPLLLVTTPASGYSTAKSFIDAAKANPRKINFASPGAGGPHHLAMELLKSRGGFEAEHVPYKGAAPAVQDLLGGQVPVMMLDTATAIPYLKANKLKALAVASPSRLSQLPDVPTFKELGYEGVEVYAWQGLVVPAATPPSIRDRLSDDLAKALADPGVQRSLTDFGLEITSSNGMQMSAFVESETKLWQALIHDRGIKLEN